VKNDTRTLKKTVKEMKKYLIPILLFLPAGMCQEPQEVIPSSEPLFCDIEEKRLFTQEEIEWRLINAPWNLKRDFRTNLAWDDEGCDVKL